MTGPHDTSFWYDTGLPQSLLNADKNYGTDPNVDQFQSMTNFGLIP